jgi:hypothetical protein
MLTHGGRGTGIRVLAVAGAFAVATLTSTLTSTVTSSAAPGSVVPVVGLTSQGVVRMPGAVSAPMHSGPDDVPGMEMDSPDVPGMEMDKPAGAHDHGATGSPTQAPESGDMPGMDMSGDGSGSAGAHEHGAATGPVTPKPLVPVLGAFGGGTAAVMLTAGMMRRKDRERLQVRQAARAARRSSK